MESSITTKHSTSMGNAIAWTAAYFLLLLLVTLLDVLIWRKVAANISVWLNLAAMVAASAVFFYLLAQKTGYAADLFSNMSIKGVVIAIGCAVLFFFLLDKFLDPVFEAFFPMSEVDYQAMISTLRKAPASSFLRTCLIAPLIEETLMRGYILGGLQRRYGVPLALAVSTVLFAALHFNMVQTLSALICGGILGLLYIKTGALFCCVLTHFLYNTISYFAMIYPV